MKTILVRGGRLIDPSAGVDAARDLLLKDGKVAAIEPPGKLTTAARQADAEIVDADAEVLAAPNIVRDLRSMNDILTGKACDVRAGSSDILAFDHGDALTFAGEPKAVSLFEPGTEDI